MHVKVINLVVLLINQEVDVWHYLQHVKHINFKKIAKQIWLVLYAIGILPQMLVLLEPATMLQIPLHLILIVTLIWLDVQWIV